MQKLKEEDFEMAATFIGCKKNVIKAIAEVEAAGDGFLDDEKPVILFEGHVFYRNTKGKFSKSHPNICFPKWDRTKYETGKTREIRGQKEWLDFFEAAKLDEPAAIMACSWGKFQILGENYNICGFETPLEFAQSMFRSEGEQLLAFIKFVKHQHLDVFLKKLDFTSFARIYNGPSFKKNKYDEKIRDAYLKFEKQDSINKSSKL